MKIVVNRGYGGFSLSPEGVESYYALKGRKAYHFTGHGRGEYKPWVPGQRTTLFFTSFDIPNPNDVGEAELWDKHFLDSRPKDRSDRDLVAVVEALWEKSWGACARLGVVEVPDGVDWEIEEYDGNEWVSEVHRKW